MKYVQAILVAGIASLAMATGALAHYSYATRLGAVPGFDPISFLDSLCLGAGQQTIDRKSRDQGSRQ
jgi:hypothetical protein